VDLAVKGLVSPSRPAAARRSMIIARVPWPCSRRCWAIRRGDWTRSCCAALFPCACFSRRKPRGWQRQHRTDEHMAAFAELLRNEVNLGRSDLAAWTAIDFDFHHLIAIASGNLLLPLLLNSFRPLYTNLSSRFFSLNAAVIDPICSPFTGTGGPRYRAGDPVQAETIMQAHACPWRKAPGARMLRREGNPSSPPAPEGGSP
jgi:hypothetical protein